MSMTKKDYELVAEVIKGRKSNHNKLYFLNWTNEEIQLAEYVIDDLANFLSYEFSRDNEEFKPERFLKQCGIKESEE